MAIINNIPRIRANYAAALQATPHLHEGKFAKLDATGCIALATSAEDALGVITEPDSLLQAQAGNVTGASLLFKTFGGIVEVQLSGDTEAIAAGDLLELADSGAVKHTSSTKADAAVAIAVEPAGATTAGQLIRAVLLPSTPTQASEAV